jgi:DnaK suppressor protein
MATNELFKLQLLEQRDALRSQLATLRGGNATSRTQASAEHFAPNQDSTAQTASEKALEFALDEHESAELRQVEAALQRLQAGTYGRCVDCGIDIPDARLHAAPEAERCIACQEAAEHA